MIWRISIWIWSTSLNWPTRRWSASISAAGSRPRWRCATLASLLVLADPLGIKVGGVLDRDIADMHALPHDAYMRLAWADPVNGERDFTGLPETELAAIARGREAFALFGWKPYMHNPRLKRWLHRIDLPTLILWGERDGIVSYEYCQAWGNEIPGSRVETIAAAGHFPHWEQPAAFVDAVTQFIDTH